MVRISTQLTMHLSRTKKILMPLLLLVCSIPVIALPLKIKKASYKHNAFIYWGWNRCSFTTSDVTFHGIGYDIKIKKMVAKDRQSPLGISPYIQLNQITIPQYNFRMGYFLKSNYSISFGWDHMKYVMVQNQKAIVNGKIENTSTPYNGTYTDSLVTLKEDFLMFEHTDGLNYLNFELRRMDNFWMTHKRKHLQFDINGFEGLGAGIMYPRSNTTILGNARYDEFHVAGFGLASVIGLQVLYHKHYFIQGELKGGYINMPDVRTTMHPSDYAKQHFFFVQSNVNFGLQFKI